jgi:Rrf2 family transcriptional regulator, iron-sulfur cluster assembly transcription factor
MRQRRVANESMTKAMRMQTTTKGRLAVVAMIDLAQHCENGPVALSAIALRRKISLSYLEQLFGKLRRGGLVLSVRGPGGGYLLALPAGSITAADIVAAVDDAVVVRERDIQGEFGTDPGRCDTSDLWRELNSRMVQFLGSVSLSTLVAQQPADALPVNASRRRRGISSDPVVKPIRTTAPNSVFSLGARLSERRGAS